MTDNGYRKRLVEDLPRWREAGWVTAEGEKAILASLEIRRSSFGLATIVGTLGALLIGAGVVAFVGANWEAMPRIVRFAILVATMAAAYGTAAMLAARDMRVFAESALLVAGLVFAAAIALVGQTYHLSGDFADAVLLWEIGILGAALLTGSSTLTILALAGAGYWTWLSVFDLEVVPHWASLLAIVIAAAMAVRIGSYYTRFVAVVALAYWIGINLVAFAAHYDWAPFEMLAVATAIALTFWAIGSLLATVSHREGVAALGHAMLWPGIGMVLLAVGFLQIASVDFRAYETMDYWFPAAGAFTVVVAGIVAVAEKRGGISFVDAAGAVAIGLVVIGYVAWWPQAETLARLVGGIIVIGAALWAINNGQTGPQRVGKTTGLVAFGIEVIYLYVVTLGTLLDTALAFLIGGVLFVALAIGLYRIDRRLSGGNEAAAGVAQ